MSKFRSFSLFVSFPAVLILAGCNQATETTTFDPTDKAHLSRILTQYADFKGLPVELFGIDIRRTACIEIMQKGQALGLSNIDWPGEGKAKFYGAKANSLFKGRQVDFELLCTPDDRLIRARYYIPSFLDAPLAVGIVGELRNKMGDWTKLDGNLNVGEFEAVWDRRLNHSIGVKRFWPRTDVIVTYQNDLLSKILQDYVDRSEKEKKAPLKDAL
jgi:hypothetical protein